MHIRNIEIHFQIHVLNSALRLIRKLSWKKKKIPTFLCAYCYQSNYLRRICHDDKLHYSITLVNIKIFKEYCTALWFILFKSHNYSSLF